MERVGGVEPHSAQLGRLATHLVLTRNGAGLPPAANQTTPNSEVINLP